MQKVLLFLMILSISTASPIDRSEILPYCPKVLKPYSSHNLKSSSILLAFSGLWKWPAGERRSCKWDVLDRNGDNLNELSAIYNNDDHTIKISGNVVFDKLYSLKGENHSKTMVYLSEKANNSDSGDWNSLIMRSEIVEPIVVDIKNEDFLNFFQKEGIKELVCNGTKCGCDNQLCENVRKNLKFKEFDFSKENKTFTLHPDVDFNYDDEYHFEMNLDRFFRSKLILEFKKQNVTYLTLYT
jgi:hypothetical protein